jgi:hypothetical protein
MKTLIILHGWQSSKDRWKKVEGLISESGIRVLCMDIPGFKHETELKEPWTLDNYIDWFKNYVTQALSPAKELKVEINEKEKRKRIKSFLKERWINRKSLLISFFVDFTYIILSMDL